MSSVADPKIGIAVVTTWPSDLEDDIANYAAAGADGIGIWEFKLHGHSDADFAKRASDAGLAVGICGPAVPSIIPDSFFSYPAGPQERTSALCSAITRFAKFSPAAVLCVTGDISELDQAEARTVAVQGMREAARCAADQGVVLAVEPQRPDQHALVSSLADGIKFIEEIGEPNVGILADVYHFWDSPNGYQELQSSAHNGTLTAVQLCDYRPSPRGPLDRLLPGDGIIDTRRVLRILADEGFGGWLDIEVFSDNGTHGSAYPDSLWDEDPAELSAKAVQKVRDLWRTR